MSGDAFTKKSGSVRTLRQSVLEMGFAFQSAGQRLATMLETLKGMKIISQRFIGAFDGPQIVCTRVGDLPTMYSWIGSRFKPIRADLKFCDELRCLPWPLVKMPRWFFAHHSNCGRVCYFVRTEGIGHAAYLGWLVIGAVLYGLTYWRAIAVRAIVRAGLATHPEGYVCAFSLLTATERGDVLIAGVFPLCLALIVWFLT